MKPTSFTNAFARLWSWRWSRALATAIRVRTPFAEISASQGAEFGEDVQREDLLSPIPRLVQHWSDGARRVFRVAGLNAPIPVNRGRAENPDNRDATLRGSLGPHS